MIPTSLNFYGLGKIMGGQFYRKGQLPPEVATTTIEQASAYDLAWSFMGYSFLYILFIGVSQINVGMVLSIMALVFGIDQFFVTFIRNL